MARVRVGVLGPLVVIGCVVPAARQQRVLLAALAAAGPAGVTADRLIDGLWRQVPADPGKALQVLVARLRKVLDVADIVVEWRDGRYRLQLRADDVDAGMFRHLCERERELPADQVDERHDVLAQALSLWRDEPFGELADEPLLAPTAMELRLRRDDVIARHHQVRLDRGEDERLLPDVTAWAHARPLDEGACPPRRGPPDRRPHADVEGGRARGAAAGRPVGIAAREQGRRVRYATCAQLVNELIEAADDRRLARLVARYGCLDLLLVDEVGYVKLDARGAELLFQVLTEREEKSSIGLASKLPFSEWGQIISDA